MTCFIKYVRTPHRSPSLTIARARLCNMQHTQAVSTLPTAHLNLKYVFLQSSAIRTKLCQTSLPPVQKSLQFSFSDIGIVDEVFEYLKWTFPLALFSDYYDNPNFLTGGASQNLSKLNFNGGSIGHNTRLVGR